MKKLINWYEFISTLYVYPATNTNRLTFDLRSKEAYHGHIEGTINIPYDKNFINQIGWYLNYNQEINLIGDYHLVSKATHTLQLIGYDDVAGYQLPQSKFKHVPFIVKILQVTNHIYWMYVMIMNGIMATYLKRFMYHTANF